MASAESPKPGCPVCHQADQVKTMQAAYATGVARCAPPDMPTRNISMSKYLVVCGIFLGLCLFLVITLVGGLENKLSVYVQIPLLIATLLFLLIALGTSYYAFQRVVRGDEEITLLYPAWDKATATWNSLFYCKRDDVVFDPQAEKLISNDELLTIRTSATHDLKNTLQQPTHAHSAVASH
jgi:hypothetical protein